MLLSRLLSEIGTECKIRDREIKYITDDSRKVTADTLFVCHEKGEKYVSQALEKGAVAVVAAGAVCENAIITDDKSIFTTSPVGFSHGFGSLNTL